MIHLALLIVSTLIVVVTCGVLLAATLWLVLGLITLMEWVIDAMCNLVAATLFCLIIPPLWAWEKLKRWARLRQALHDVEQKSVRAKVPERTLWASARTPHNRKR